MTLALPGQGEGSKTDPGVAMKFGLFFAGIARVVLPPDFDKEAVSRGREKIGNEVVARM